MVVALSVERPVHCSLGEGPQRVEQARHENGHGEDGGEAGGAGPVADPSVQAEEDQQIESGDEDTD